MAGYLRQGGQVVLILTRAEALALSFVAEKTLDNHQADMNPATREAAERGTSALAAATNSSARMAGSFTA